MATCIYDRIAGLTVVPLSSVGLEQVMMVFRPDASFVFLLCSHNVSAGSSKSKTFKKHTKTKSMIVYLN